MSGSGPNQSKSFDALKVFISRNLGWTTIRQNLATAILISMITVYSVIFSWITSQRYSAFQSSLDLGSNLAVLEGAIKGWQPGWILLTHEGALFSYAFVPLLWAFPSADTILVAQTLLIALGAVPLYFFARLKLRSELVALILSASYLICPSIQALNWFDFHPEVLGMAFVFAFFYFLETRNHRLAVVFCFLSLSVSTLVAIGLVAWLAANALLSLNRLRIEGASDGATRLRKYFELGLALSALFFLTGLEFLNTLLTQGIGVVTGKAGVNLTYPGVGSSATSVLLAPLVTPHAFLSNLLFEYNLKILYVILMFGLFLFLPLFDFRALAGTVPWLFLSFSSTNTPLFTVPYFQYSALLIPFLFYGFINRLSKSGTPFLEDWGLLWLTIVLVIPFAVSPPYSSEVFSSYLLLLLVVPIVLTLTLALKANHGNGLKRVTLDWRSRRSASLAGGSDPGARPHRLLGRGLFALVAISLGLQQSAHRSPRRRRYATVGILFVMGLLLFSLWTPYGSLASRYVNAYVKPVVTQHDNAFNRFLGLLPQNATILAQDHLYAHLWNYRFVSVHPTPGVYADFILGDVGAPGENQPDYFEPIVTPFPALSQIVLENLTRGSYGVLAESNGYFLLKHNYTGPPELFSPLNVSVNPCSLNIFPSANMACIDNHLTQTSNPSGTTTAWYGPYDTLPSGTFTVRFQLELNRTPTTSPVTLGVYSFLPGTVPVSETLASDKVSPSAFAGANVPTNITLNFTVPYPGLIQFTGNYVPAGITITLDALVCSQQSATV